MNVIKEYRKAQKASASDYSVLNQDLDFIANKKRLLYSKTVNLAHRLITDHNHPTPAADTTDGYIPCLRFKHANNNWMGNNKRANSHGGQIQDKYPNNRKTYANKRHQDHQV